MQRPYAARLQGGNSEDDARLALWTLSEVLMTMAKTMAPFTPFFAEWMYQHMRPYAAVAKASRSQHPSLTKAPLGSAAEVVVEWETPEVRYQPCRPQLATLRCAVASHCNSSSIFNSLA